MAKKQKPVVPTASADKLTHNPFAALVGTSEPVDARSPEPVPPHDDEPLVFRDKVVVRREKKGRGGKTVTRVQGLPADHREALMHRLKKTLGCGASLDEDDVLLHGSLVDRAADWLEAQGAKRVSRSA